MKIDKMKKIGFSLIKNPKDFGTQVKKGSKVILNSKKKYNFDSRNIRLRYHRLRKAAYNETFEKGLRLEKPIFIVGVPHSGTSVLSSTFKQHPDIAMWTEAPEVFEPYWAEGVDSEYNRLVAVNEDYAEQFDIFRITDAFYRYTKSKRKTRFMNKNPRNIVRISYLKKIFPDSKIIHIFRDGRDVVNSITRNMPEFMIPEICDRWINSLQEIEKQSKKIESSDFYEIKYEEFCIKPQEILTEAYKKCELYTNEKIISRLPNKLTNFNGKWKTEINEKQHSGLRQKLEPMMIKLGYTW